MSTPTRRRPTGPSPIKLTPQVEEVRTWRADEETEAAPAPTPAQQTVTAETPTPSPPEESGPAPAVAPAQVPVGRPFETDEKKPTTLNIRRSVKARAETAVLRTASLEGGYKSWASFVEGALERELERLEQVFNGGEPFPPNQGSFRQGRPLGS